MISILFENPIAFLGLITAFMLAVMLHEVGHGYAALKCGDPTAKYMGRLNLNPQAHFDLMGTIMFLFIGFGYAKPVPVCPDNFKNYKKGSIIVSLAGVTVNLILAFITFPIFRYVMEPLLLDAVVSQNQIMIGFATFGYYFFAYFVSMNLVFLVFNLLPLYPLDGYNFLDMVLPYGNKFMNFTRQNSNLLFLAFILVNWKFNIIGYLSNIIQWPIMKFWGLIFG